MVTAERKRMSVGDSVRLIQADEYLQDVPDLEVRDKGKILEISESGKMVLFNPEDGHEIWIYPSYLVKIGD